MGGEENWAETYLSTGAGRSDERKVHVSWSLQTHVKGALGVEVNRPSPASQDQPQRTISSK